MKIFLKVFACVLVFTFAGCQEEPKEKEQLYDLFEYQVNSSDFEKCMTEAEKYPAEPTKEDLNNFELWIIQNTNAQLYIGRDLSQKDITNALLDFSSVSRDEISTIFKKADIVGKVLFVLYLPNDLVEIAFIEKL